MNIIGSHYRTRNRTIRILLIGNMQRVPNNIKLGTQTNAWGIDTNDIQTFYTVLDQIRDHGLEGVETRYRTLSLRRTMPGMCVTV